MNLVVDDIQAEVADSARRLMRSLDIPRVIREAPRGERLPDAETWRRYVDQGWLALGLPDDAGGIGYGLAEECVLMIEVGRALAPGPILPTMLAAHAAYAAGDAVLANAFADGSQRAGLVASDQHVDCEDRTVTGDLVVVDGASADVALHAASQQCALIDVREASWHSLECVDPGSRLSRVNLQAAPLSGVLTGESARLLRLRGQVLAAAQLTGIAEATRDMSVAYCTDRVQFGRPIGTFQAVSRRCADMAVRAEASRSQTLYAALRLAGNAKDAELQVASALAIAMDAAYRNSADNMQNHGGIGMTYEHDAHLYLTRTNMITRSYGPREVVLRELLAAAPAELTSGR